MNARLTGLMVGIALGFAAAFGGWAALVIVAVLSAAGYLVGRAVQGELDLTPYVSGRRRSDR